MRERGRTTRLLSLFGLLVVVGCGERDEIVSVAGVGFTEAELAPLDRSAREALADLAAFGRAAADGEAVAVLAPVVEAERTVATAALLGYALVGEEFDDRALRPWYEANPRWELTVRHVVRLVDERAGGEEERAQRDVAARVRERALRGEDFAALAAEHSEEPGAAERGGLLEPGRRGSWVEPFWEAASGLDPGEVSEVVRTRYGYHVIRPEARRPLDFEEVPRAEVLREAIPSAHARSAVESFAGEAEARLTLDRAGLERALSDWRDGRPPVERDVASWPGGTFTDRALVARIALLDGGEERRFRSDEPGALAQRVRDFARSAMYAERTRALGVRLPPSEADGIRRDWEHRVARWSAAVGVGRGADTDRIRERALAVAVDDDQETRILRDELRRIRPFLRERYPVSEYPSGSTSSESVITERNR